MVNFVYNTIKEDIATGTDISSADLRAALVMTNTTVDTEDNADTFADFTDEDECDGASYARDDIANVTAVRDDPNDMTYINGDDSVFTNLGVGTRQNQAVLVHIHHATPGMEIPVAFIDTGGFPFDGTGSNTTIQWNALGILQLT